MFIIVFYVLRCKCNIRIDVIEMTILLIFQHLRGDYTGHMDAYIYGHIEKKTGDATEMKNREMIIIKRTNTNILVTKKQQVSTKKIEKQAKIRIMERQHSLIYFLNDFSHCLCVFFFSSSLAFLTKPLVFIRYR